MLLYVSYELCCVRLQIGESEIDHNNFLRCELDDVTPRTQFVTLPPSTPGADLLYQVAAAYAMGALALTSAGGSGDLATRATQKAGELFMQAGSVPGLYSDSIPEAGRTYPNDSWEGFGFWAAAVLFRLTGDQQYQLVRC